MAETVTYILEQYLPAELVVFVISMLPILELRGGIVAAKLLGLPWVRASLLCIAGTMIPVPFILLFIKQILAFLKKTKLFHKIASHYEEKARSGREKIADRHLRKVQWGLFFFVAIPLPGTGAWTGSLIASFMDLRLKDSIPPIIAGVFTAALIMLGLAYGIPSLIF